MVNFPPKLYLTQTGSVNGTAHLFRGLVPPQVQRSFQTLPCAILVKRFPEKTMDEKQAPPPQGQVQIKADEKELQGMYSNLVMIHHHAEEFTLNFVYVFPNGPQGKLLASVIVSPGHAKRIWRALGENLARYEAQFGPIKETPEGATPAGTIGFVQ
jgi:hypothetical protein